jgi:uncharacterized membrane protein
VNKTIPGIALAAVLSLAAAAAAEPARPAASPAKTWRGLMVDHHGRMYFYPCGQQARFQPKDATREKDLASLFRKLAGDFDQPVFMELEGAASGKDIKVTRLLRANNQSGTCQENLEGIVFKAFGSDPDWRMAMDGNALRIQRLEDTAPASYPSRKLVEQRGKLVYEGRNEASEMSVELSPERCQDPGIGSVYPYKAAVTSGGQNLQGCAYLGAAAR